MTSQGSSDRSERVRALFEAVAGLGPDERAARLADACGDDEALRREVESLLEAEDAQGSDVRRALEGMQPLEEENGTRSAPSASDDVPAALQTALADRYTLLREIGRGGMATVYLADDPRLERRVAIKVLRPELAAVLGTGRFLQEIKLTAGLAHPHILPLHDSGDAGGFLYYVMPYVEGESLRGRMNREGPLAIGDALRITREVADALGSAHARGIVHRDIKPENILLEEGHAVVADFGIARAVDAAGGTRVAETTGIILGTPRYMSPEQVAGDRDLDGRSDLYSLGCVLYEMLAGKPPVSDRSVPRLLSRKVTGEFPSVGEVRPEVPSEVDYTVTRALATDPGERFGTAGELVAALDPLTPRARPVTTTSARSRVIRRTAMSLGAVVVIGGAAWLTLGGPSTTDRAVPSIAVLPFENLSRHPDSVDHFVHGLREDVAGHLGRISTLTVRPLESVGRVYGDGDNALRDIASELRVSSLLAASVLWVDNSFRLNVRLIEAEGETIAWQDTYERDYTTASDIFATLSEVAERIASALGAELTAQERSRIEQHPTEDLQAWTLHKRGRLLESRATPESLKRAIALYEQAIELDPEYGEAYAGLASAYTLLSQVERWTPGEYASRVTAAAERALEVDSTLAEPHRILADVKWLWAWDFFGAEQGFDRALSLDPDAPMTHLIYAQFLNFVAGRHEEALRHSLQAQEIDPVDPFITANVGWRYQMLGMFDEALEEYRKALEIDPDHWVPYWGRGLTYSSMGLYDEAITNLELALEHAGGGLDVASALGVAYAQVDRRADAERVLGQLLETAETEYVPASWLAQLYAGLGEMDMAFQWLERAVEERDQTLTWMLVEPVSADSLVSDPRFEGLWGSIGLSEYRATRNQG